MSTRPTEEEQLAEYRRRNREQHGREQARARDEARSQARAISTAASQPPAAPPAPSTNAGANVPPRTRPTAAVATALSGDEELARHSREQLAAMQRNDEMARRNRERAAREEMARTTMKATAGEQRKQSGGGATAAVGHLAADERLAREWDRKTQQEVNDEALAMEMQRALDTIRDEELARQLEAAAPSPYEAPRAPAWREGDSWAGRGDWDRSRRAASDEDLARMLQRQELANAQSALRRSREALAVPRPAISSVFGVPLDIPIFGAGSESGSDSESDASGDVPFSGIPGSVDSMSYDELLRLGDMIGEVKPRGASQGLIDAIPIVEYDPVKMSGAPKSCGICLEDYAVGDTLKLLPCTHFFHVRCIDHWLELNSTCPTCREKVKFS